MSQSRSGQLLRFLDLLNSGSPTLPAAQQAFGDLAQLQHELTVYKHQPSLIGMKISAARIRPGPIEVTPLSEPAAAAILLRADLKMHGDDKAAAQRLTQRIRAIETQHPGDVLVETTLAEAELDAGDVAAAELAADIALKADPRNVEAMIYKGRATEERARSSSGADRREAFEQARQLFSAANKIDTEDPEPLWEYYRSFVVEGVRPTDNAIAALHYASDLVPQALGLRVNSAIAYLNQDKPADARATLTVVAYSPHQSDAADLARRMIADIDGGKAKAAAAEVKQGSK
jgi:tetratricopeptide (TPR) repeat protein